MNLADHQRQRIESLRRLAGKIAHDFNNILTTMTGYADLLAMDGALSTDSRQCVDEIKRSVEKAGRLTGQLLTFSRNELTRTERIDVNILMRNLEPRLRSTLGEDVEIEMDLGNAVPPVCSDPQRLEEAVLLLAQNARDAMPRGGVFAAATLAAAVNGTRQAAVPPAGTHAVIELRDTGCGLDEETAERIFEPFFSTRDNPDKPGLGLTRAWTTVLQSGGFIRCSNLPEGGALFQIYLPAWRSETREP